MQKSPIKKTPNGKVPLRKVPLGKVPLKKVPPGKSPTDWKCPDCVGHYYFYPVHPVLTIHATLTTSSEISALVLVPMK